MMHNACYTLFFNLYDKNVCVLVMSRPQTKQRFPGAILNTFSIFSQISHSLTLEALCGWAVTGLLR